MGRWPIILVGLLVLAGLSWACIRYGAPAIQADIDDRVEAAMLTPEQSEDLADVNVFTDGQDIRLTGTVVTETARLRAGEIATGEAGVWSVDNRIQVVVPQPEPDPLPVESPYLMSAVKSADGTATVTGFVPEEAAGDRLVALAGDTYGERLNTDGISLAAGMPGDEWLDFAADGLVLLDRLSTGEMRLSDAEMTLTGEAPDAATRDSVEATLNAALPEAYVARTDIRLPLPVAAPYAFSASLADDGTVEIAGNVPDEATRADIMRAANDLFAPAQVVDRLTLAAGMPGADWPQLALQGLERLATLNTGRLEVTDLDVSLAGEAPSVDVRDTIQSSFAGLMPSGAAADTSGIVAALPLADPYRFEAVKAESGAVTLYGVMPDAATRAEIAGQARAIFGADAVTDTTTLADGMPADSWPDAIRGGLELMRTLDYGRFELVDRAGTLAGLAPTLAERDRLVEAGANAFPLGLTLDTTTLEGKLPLADPYRLIAMKLDNGMVSLEGNMPDEDTKARLNEVARSLFGPSAVTDNSVIARGLPAENWPEVVISQLRALSRLERGTLDVTNTDIRLSGMMARESERNALVERFVSEAPDGYDADATAVEARIRLVSPYTFTAERNTGGSVRLSGFVPDEATLTGIRDAAAALFGAANVIDETVIAEGMPAADWPDTVRAGLGQLAALRDGRFSIADTQARLVGLAPNAGARDEIVGDIAAGLPAGFVVDTTGVNAALPIADPYTIEVALTPGGRVTIDGVLPDEAARDTVQTALASAFPDAQVVDRTTFAEGLPDEDWIGALSGGINGLARLQQGALTLIDRDLRLAGTIRTESARNALIADFTAGLPAGYAGTAEPVDATVPLAVPFAARLVKGGDGTVSISGVMPDAETQTRVEMRARGVFGPGNVENRTTIAEGMPRLDWPDALIAGMPALADLSSGELSLTDTDLQLSGTAETQRLRTRILDNFGAAIPPAYTADATPTTFRLPTVSPFAFEAVRADDGSVTLSGVVPSEAARDTVRNRAADLFGAPALNSNLTVADGAPRPDWIDAAMDGLAALAELQSGRFALSDLDGTLVGMMPTQRQRDAFVADLRDRTRQDYTLDPGGVAYALPSLSPFPFEGVLSQQGRVSLSGAAPTDADREMLLARARALFGETAVDGDLTVADGAPNLAWADAAAKGLEALSALQAGRFTLSDMDASLAGSIATERERERLLAELPALSEPGYTIDGSAVDFVLPSVDRFSLVAEKTASGVRLSGTVPDEATAETLTAEARGVLSDDAAAGVTVDLQPADGDLRENWIEMAQIGVRLLADLNTGRFELRDLNATLDGQAPTERQRDQIANAVIETAPAGFAVDATALTFVLRSVSPYVFEAEKGTDGMVTLSGFVPDGSINAQIAGRARALFGPEYVVNRTEIADGMPRADWPDLVQAGLQELAKLDEGRLSLSDLDVSLAGVADTEATRDQIKAAAEANLPAFAAVSTDIEARIPNVDRFTLSGALDEAGNVTLRGVVPDQTTLDRLIARAEQVFGAGNIASELTLATGPVPAGWAEVAAQAIQGLGALDSGSFDLVDTRLAARGTVEGEAADRPAREAFRAALGSTFTLDETIDVRLPLVSPYTVRVIKGDVADGQIRVDGSVPTDEARKQLLDTLRETFGRTPEGRDLSLARGVPDDRWMALVIGGIDGLARLEHGEWRLTDRTAMLAGRAESEDVRDAVIEAVATLVPLDYVVETAITAPERPRLPVADPYTLTADKTESGVLVVGVAPDETTADQLRAAARSVFPTLTDVPQLTLADGMPGENWPLVTADAFRALARLETGRLIVRDTTVILTGIAATEADRVAARAALADAVTDSYSGDAEGISVRLPLASPYQFTATKAIDGRLSISGDMPNSITQGDVRARAEALFGTVADTTRLARGAPIDWALMVRAGLPALERLEQGTWSVTDTEGRLTGEAQSVGDRDAAIEALRLGNVAGLTTTTDISAPDPLPLASPFELRITREPTGRTIATGVVPNEAARTQLGTLLRESYAPDAAIGAVGIARGAPDAAWTGVMLDAAAAAAPLETALMLISDRDVTVEGRAATLEMKGTIEDALAAATPATYTLRTFITAPAPVQITPLTLEAEIDSLGVVLSGTVPNQASRDALIDRAQAVFGNGRVADRLTIAPGVPPEGLDPTAWTTFALEGLLPLSSLDTGIWQVENDEATLRGQAPNNRLGDGASMAISTLNAGSFVAQSDITVPAPPPPPAPPPVTVQSCQERFNEALSGEAILFETNRAVISEDSARLLDRLAEIAGGCPGLSIEISGHTDSRGSENYNMQLSLLRAEAVRVALIQRGVDDDRLTAVGYGEDRPIADNGTPAGRSRNRRIEFEVSE